MDTKYYGWLGPDWTYGSVIKAERDGPGDYYKFFVFNRVKKEFRRDDYYGKAMWDPGSDFEEITEEEANNLIAEWTK